MDVYGKPSVQNDRQIYEDFKAEQARLREQYAGAPSKNYKGAMHYSEKSGFSKYKKQHMNPNENKFNIFERQTAVQVPKTRDRFTHNPLAKLLNPDI